MRRRARFDRPGMLAIHPQSWGMDFEIVADAGDMPPFRTEGAVAVVDVYGPLQHHAGFWCDSYDAILLRVAAALASPATAVMLNIDSPGGETAGAFEASRDLRAMADAAGKQLFAFADGMMASAAYALACSADTVFAQPTALVGSIGVIAMTVDETARDAAMGLGFSIIASGQRKADGNPHQPITDDAKAAIGVQVDELAEIFFELVAERRAMTPDVVRSLEAGCFSAAGAASVGLVDAVMTWTEVLAAIAAGGTTPAKAADAKGPNMKYEELLAALKSMADGEGDDAESAKKALKALQSADEVPAKTDPAPEPDGDEGKGGEGDGDGDEGKPAAAAGGVTVVALAKRVQELEAEHARHAVKAERDKLLAQRPDFGAEVVAVLGHAKTPLAVVRDAVKTWPRGQKPATSPAASAQPSVAATRGAGNVDGSESKLPAAEKLELDRQMGLAPASAAIRLERNVQILPVLTPEDARRRIAATKENV